jgi:Family of unknown function (DUF5985)
MTQHDFAVALGGVIVAGFAVAALLLLRFWRRTRDRLFLWFAVAFALLGVQRSVMLATQDQELAAPSYILRLVAFGVIIWAVADKNRSAPPAD